MEEARNISISRNIIAKIMGLIVAPFVFSVIACGILLLIANTFVGDVVGYGSVLFLPPVDESGLVEKDFILSTEYESKDGDTLDIRDVTFPSYQQVYGEISIPEADILCPLIYGDSTEALKRGAGQYIGSRIIGYGGTTMICAHVNRHFANLHKVERGNLIQIRTEYGVYTYEVYYTGVHSATDKSVYDLAREDENVVLYTCYYQQTALGNVKMRYFVCAKYLSGPLIVDRRDGS